MRQHTPPRHTRPRNPNPGMGLGLRARARARVAHRVGLAPLGTARVYADAAPGSQPCHPLRRDVSRFFGFVLNRPLATGITPLQHPFTGVPCAVTERAGTRVDERHSPRGECTRSGRAPPPRSPASCAAQSLGGSLGRFFTAHVTRIYSRSAFYSRPAPRTLPSLAPASTLSLAFFRPTHHSLDMT